MNGIQSKAGTNMIFRIDVFRFFLNDDRKLGDFTDTADDLELSDVFQ